MQRWLRFKACLAGKHRVDVPEPDGVSTQDNNGQSPSRIQQNLSWLPVQEAPEPFSTPLPGCPPLWPEDTELRARYLTFVAHAEHVGWLALTEHERERGRELAKRWLSRAIDLSSAKATEQCAEIYWYMQCAAIASLFADGASAESFIGYRKHVDHYKDSRQTADQVQAFGRYVESVMLKAASGEGDRC